MSFLKKLEWLQSTFEKKPWIWPLLISVVSIIMIYTTLKQYKNQLEANVETVPVLVTRRSMMAHEKILEAEDIDTKHIIKKYLPMGVVYESDLSRILGRLIKKTTAEGELLLWSHFDNEGSPAVPASQIAKGYRALSIPVDEESAISFLARPGDHVDLLVTVTPKSSSESTTLTLLQNLAVLHTQTTQNAQESSYSSVVLMVTPKEAAIIRHAQTKSKITLTLRNPHDHMPGDGLPYIYDQQLYETAFRQAIQRERERSEQSVEIIKNFKE